MTSSSDDLSSEGYGRTDRGAEFVRLLKQHDRRLAAFVHALVPDWNDAEDVIQETSVRLWKQFDNYRSEGDFGAWACTIARYLIAARRKSVSRSPLVFQTEVVDLLAEETAAVQTEASRHLSCLSRCLQQISEQSRDLLRRCYASGMAIKDVARELGRSEGSVYTALSRIRRTLHECIEENIRREDEQA